MPSRPPSVFGSRSSDFPRAFTLIEMLVVISILGILAAMLMPAVARAREQGRGAACMSNLRQAGASLQLYLQDNNNRLPAAYDRLLDTNGLPANPALPTIDAVLTNYLGNHRILKCPSDQKRLFETTGSSYSWNVLLNGQDADHLEVMGLQFNPHQIPLLYDKDPFHLARGPGKGANFLYADGHIKNIFVLEGGR